MKRARRGGPGGIAAAVPCYAAALRLDMSTSEGIAGATLIAHIAEDLRMLRAGMIEEK